MNGKGLKHTFSSLRNAMFQNLLDHAFRKNDFEIFLLSRFSVL